jgi:hypothetical protein
LLSNGQIIPYGGQYMDKENTKTTSLTERDVASKQPVLDLGLNISDKVTKYKQTVSTLGKVQLISLKFNFLDEIVLDRIEKEKFKSDDVSLGFYPSRIVLHT